jgi:hypothetical protein
MSLEGFSNIVIKKKVEDITLKNSVDKPGVLTRGASDSVGILSCVI